jgi:hypothetical protein
MDRLYHVYDCKGTLIFCGEYALNDKKKCLKLSKQQYAKTIKCLTTPTIIIESNSGLTCYYYRAISMQETLLISADHSYGIWKLKEYIENPTGSFVLSLIKDNLREGNLGLHFKKYYNY